MKAALYIVLVVAVVLALTAAIIAVAPYLAIVLVLCMVGYYYHIGKDTPQPKTEEDTSKRPM
jgi:fatty acid desaturase